MRRTLNTLLAVILLTPLALSAPADLISGRKLGAKTFSLSAKLGSISTLEGEIQETKRAGTDIPGWQAGYGHYLENYSLDELGFDEEYLSLGLVLEKQWKFVTLEFEASYINLTADEVARRDYYLGVEEISYGGRTYEYMMIPDGESYEGDLQGGLFNLKTKFTPFSLTAGEHASITPWIHIGIFSAIGFYEIDAGPAQGVIQYEFPPRDYVVGGKGEGWGGIVLPDIGIGGEIKFPVGRTTAGPVKLALQGDVGIFQYDGDTSDIGISARHNKSIDLDYLTYELKGTVEIPLSNATELLISLGLEHTEADAVLEAKEAVEIEKYDKDVEFELDRVFMTIGVRY